MLGERDQSVVKAFEQFFNTLSKLEGGARALRIPVLVLQRADVDVILVQQVVAEGLVA